MKNKFLKLMPESLLQNKHFNTIYPTLFRKIKLNYARELIVTQDFDFFHVDFIKNESENLIILCHGFEGSSNSSYIKGLSQFLSSKNCDILVINNRGCSGEPNLNVNFCHYGFTDDLKLTINKFYKNYKSIGLVGFSMGGNLILKYLGENEFIPQKLKASVVISPVLDLKLTLKSIDSLKNCIYKHRFLNSIKNKTLMKYKQNPYLFNKKFDIKTLKKIKSFQEYDTQFNLPHSSFFSIDSFYKQNSSIFYLKKICVPTYILSSLDDPLVPLPLNLLNRIFSQNKNLNFELTTTGGHVGFLKKNKAVYWHETKIYNFLSQKINL